MTATTEETPLTWDPRKLRKYHRELSLRLANAISIGVQQKITIDAQKEELDSLRAQQEIAKDQATELRADLQAWRAEAKEAHRFRATVEAAIRGEGYVVPTGGTFGE